MALHFNWDLWSGNGFGEWGPPVRMSPLWIVRNRCRISVVANGRWESRTPRPLYWLEVTGDEEEIAALEDQTLIDLVEVRYGSGN